MHGINLIPRTYILFPAECEKVFKILTIRFTRQRGQAALGGQMVDKRINEID